VLTTAIISRRNTNEHYASLQYQSEGKRVTRHTRYYFQLSKLVPRVVLQLCMANLVNNRAGMDLILSAWYEGFTTI